MIGNDSFDDIQFEAHFPAVILNKYLADDGVWYYSWTELRIDTDTGLYVDADPARSGLVIPGGDGTSRARELNNTAIDDTLFPFNTYMRFRSTYEGDTLYDFERCCGAATVTPPVETVTVDCCPNPVATIVTGTFSGGTDDFVTLSGTSVTLVYTTDPHTDMPISGPGGGTPGWVQTESIPIPVAFTSITEYWKFYFYCGGTPGVWFYEGYRASTPSGPFVYTFTRTRTSAVCDPFILTFDVGEDTLSTTDSGLPAGTVTLTTSASSVPSGNLVVGTTTITGGSDGYVLTVDGGVLGSEDILTLTTAAGGITVSYP